MKPGAKESQSTSRNKNISLPPSSFLIRVPASTSNLGPGFDTLGLALDLTTDYAIQLLERGPTTLHGQAGGTPLRLKDFPFFPMMEKIFALAGTPPPPLAVTVKGEVPIGVGLGWSAAARVAGALAANTMLGSPLTMDQLLALLVEAEGHPDNVTPALMGGLTATVRTPEGPLVHAYRPAALWRFVILAPDYSLSTDRARMALPREVPLADAVFNLSRVPFVLEALVAGDAPQLARVMEDRLHEPIRGRKIKRYRRIRQAAGEAGAVATFISGAGPALAAVCAGPARARNVLKAMLEAIQDAPFTARGFILRPAPQGARVKDE
jgi:homoserine kinase